MNVESEDVLVSNKFVHTVDNVAESKYCSSDL
jgi:hypothetical protein